MSTARCFLSGLAAASLLTASAGAQTLDLSTPDSSLAEAAAAPAAPIKTSKDGLDESVAAVVNDEVVSTYDLRQRMLLLLVTSGLQPTEQNINEVQHEALRGLVDEHLEMQEIRHVEAKQKTLHLEPTPKEVDEEIETMAQANNVKGATLLATLKSAGVNPETLRDQIGAQMAWRHYMGGRFGSNIKIGDEQIAAAEARLMASAAKPQYQVSEIFLDSTRVGGEEQAMNGAQQLIAQIKQGAPFAAVARQFSARPTAANGGDAGWLSASDLPAGVGPVLDSMRPGQLSAPIPTATGVYVLLLRDKRAGAGAVLVNLKQAAVRLGPDAPAGQVAQAETKLKALKGEVAGCSDFEEKASRESGLVEGDLGETEASELAPQFREIVDTLKVGQVGGPVRTNAGLHLIALCGRRPSGAKSATRDDLENRLYGEQLSMVAKRFLRDLRNSATIESR
jgi:peptidyl-prolyl cis-trans isomerase SurA